MAPSRPSSPSPVPLPSLSQCVDHCAMTVEVESHGLQLGEMRTDVQGLAHRVSELESVLRQAMEDQTLRVVAAVNEQRAAMVERLDRLIDHFERLAHGR